MKVIGLFSGIGGFEFGFSEAGFEVIAVCENDPFCQTVLKERFPEAYRVPDVRLFSAEASPAKTSQSRVVKLVWKEGAVASGWSSDVLSVSWCLTGLSSRTLAIPGRVGCPVCGATCKGSDIPACRFECEPVTWEPPMPAPESSLLPTPTASSYGSCRGGGAGRVGKWRKSLDGLGIKSPEYREWMMGYPIGWTATRPSATPSSRKSRKSSPKVSRR